MLLVRRCGELPEERARRMEGVRAFIRIYEATAQEPPNTHQVDVGNSGGERQPDRNSLTQSIGDLHLFLMDFS
jgi:hypothetical protein